MIIVKGFVPHLAGSSWPYIEAQVLSGIGYGEGRPLGDKADEVVPYNFSNVSGEASPERYNMAFCWFDGHAKDALEKLEDFEQVSDASRRVLLVLQH